MRDKFDGVRARLGSVGLMPTDDSSTARAQPSEQSDPAHVVARLDLETKVRLLSGRGFWALHPLPDHGIDGIIVADGPHGLRCQVKDYSSCMWIGVVRSMQVISTFVTRFGF